LSEALLPRFDLRLLVLLVLTELHLETLELSLGGLETIVNRVQLLGLKHSEGLVLDLLLVGHAALLLVTLLKLGLVGITVLLALLHLLFEFLPL
jgi:hypothetical protein